MIAPPSRIEDIIAPPYRIDDIIASPMRRDGFINIVFKPGARGHGDGSDLPGGGREHEKKLMQPSILIGVAFMSLDDIIAPQLRIDD